MSSILRALKKLEEEGAVKDSRHGWPQGVAPYVRVDRKAGSRRLWLVVGLLSAALLLVGVGWLFRGGDAPAPLGEEMVAEKPLVPAVGEPSVEVVASTITDPVAAPVVNVAPRPRETTAPLVEQREGKATRGDVAPPLHEVSKTAELPLPAVVDIPEGRRSVEAVVDSLSLPVLNTPDLQLQAVAWSERPEQRVAVIGNRVVKEGDFVVGYVVVQINQDDIVVRKQGVMNRILFNGR